MSCREESTERHQKAVTAATHQLYGAAKQTARKYHFCENNHHPDTICVPSTEAIRNPDNEFPSGQHQSFLHVQLRDALSFLGTQERLKCSSNNTDLGDLLVYCFCQQPLCKTSSQFGVLILKAGQVCSGGGDEEEEERVRESH